MSNDSLHAAAATPYPAAPTVAPMRVLVVEAAVVPRNLLRAHFKKEASLDVVAVATGEAALEAYRKQTFDLVVLDVILPGISGTEAAKAIAALAKARKDWLYLTYTTASALSPEDLDIIEYGVCDLIKKPVLLPTLSARVATVRELITARRYAAEADLRLKSMMDQSTDGLILMGRHGLVLDANRAAERVLGCEPGTLVGSRLAEFVPTKHRDGHDAYCATDCLPAAGHKRQVPAVKRDGTTCVVDLSMTQVHLPRDGQCIVLSITDGTEKIAFDSEIQFVATHDTLTQLPNRQLMQDRLTQAVALAKRHGRQMALLFIDLDGFKLVNDTYGHTAGDKVLLELAHRFKALVRDGDTVCHQCGDEFVVILSEIACEADAAAVAHRFLEAAGKPVCDGGQIYQVGASIGIALYPAAGGDAETLMRHADMAMYHVKGTGKGAALSFSQAMQDEATRKVQMENMLHDALRNNEFVLFYQPQINSQTGALEGVEALIRWRRDGKLIMPDQFIPVAEATGIIVPLGEWVASEAARQSADWRQRYGWAPIISVNVSANGFNERLVGHVMHVLNSHRLPPMALALEITESMLSSDLDDTVRSMAQLREHGVAIAVDDFGTGYSAMAHLRRFPLSTLKIDKAFIAQLGDRRDAAIAHAILTIAQSLSLKTVAEGVETKEQLEWLQRMGCDTWQGYYASPPRPPEDIVAMYPESFKARAA